MSSIGRKIDTEADDEGGEDKQVYVFQENVKEKGPAAFECKS